MNSKFNDYKRKNISFEHDNWELIEHFVKKTGHSPSEIINEMIKQFNKEQ